MSSNSQKKRQHISKIFPYILLTAVFLSVLILISLVFNIIDTTFGYVVLENKIDAAELGLDAVLVDNTAEELALVLEENLTRGMVRRLRGKHAHLTELELSPLAQAVQQYVMQPELVKSYSFFTSIFSAGRIKQEVADEQQLEFRSWLSIDLLRGKQSSNALETGIFAAILGTLWIVFLTIIITVPIGIGTAIFLEEYARSSSLNRLIQINIYNLSGVPSIIYGLLGLAVFVRFMGPITSGMMFNSGNENGRTILSAGLTMSLLIMPIVIINAKEAIAAVPRSLKDSSYALGATKWQTIWHHCLPYCMDRILTGSILSISRAVGETAPLVVIGASTFLTVDPTSLFSKFTALPIQIYQLSSRPQAEFKHVAAASIIILLVLMLGMNLAAIILRNSIQAKKR